MNHKLLNAIVLFFCLFSLSAWAGDQATNTETKLIKVIITSLDPSYTNMNVLIGDAEEKLKLDDNKAKELKTKLKIQKGDRIGIILGEKSQDYSMIKEIKSIEKKVGVKDRLLSILFGIIIVLGSFALFASGRLHAYIIGVDKRVSNSKFQIALWFFTLFTVYLATLILRVHVYDLDLLGGIGITDNLLALTGLSAFSYGSAKAITSSQFENSKNQSNDPGNTQQKRNESAQAVDNKENKNGSAAVKQLFTDDSGNIDFGDTQMFFVTLMTVIIFTITSFHFLEWIEFASKINLPDVDSTLLSVFGVGQGAYLAKKAATPLGK